MTVCSLTWDYADNAEQNSTRRRKGFRYEKLKKEEEEIERHVNDPTYTNVTKAFRMCSNSIRLRSQ